MQHGTYAENNAMRFLRSGRGNFDPADRQNSEAQRHLVPVVENDLSCPVLVPYLRQRLGPAMNRVPQLVQVYRYFLTGSVIKT